MLFVLNLNLVVNYSMFTCVAAIYLVMCGCILPSCVAVILIYLIMSHVWLLVVTCMAVIYSFILTSLEHIQMHIYHQFCRLVAFRFGCIMTKPSR